MTGELSKIVGYPQSIGKPLYLLNKKKGGQIDHPSLHGLQYFNQVPDNLVLQRRVRHHQPGHERPYPDTH